MELGSDKTRGLARNELQQATTIPQLKNTGVGAQQEVASRSGSRVISGENTDRAPMGSDRNPSSYNSVMEDSSKEPSHSDIWNMFLAASKRLLVLKSWSLVESDDEDEENGNDEHSDAPAEAREVPKDGSKDPTDGDQEHGEDRDVPTGMEIDDECDAPSRRRDEGAQITKNLPRPRRNRYNELGELHGYGQTDNGSPIHCSLHSYKEMIDRNLHNLFAIFDDLERHQDEQEEMYREWLEHESEEQEEEEEDAPGASSQAVLHQEQAEPNAATDTAETSAPPIKRRKKWDNGLSTTVTGFESTSDTGTPKSSARRRMQ